MKRNMTVNVVTPNGVVYDQKARFVVAKTINGELGILANHAPIIAPLIIDEVRITGTASDEQVNYIAVNGGVMEVRDNVVTIIADSAEKARDIDISRAQRAKQRAQEKIAAAKKQSDIDAQRRAEVALHRALNRINVSKHR
ncbi:MAG TPA: F0F1 ATP synthase subunit epsilon [Tetragenococcus sp.]|nr:F0F1 ATP synthase subunit epsilon [Tetragenococcus sp.]